MGLDRADRKLKPLWITLLIATVLLLLAWSWLFWSPGEPSEGQVPPQPLLVPQ